MNRNIIIAGLAVLLIGGGVYGYLTYMKPLLDNRTVSTVVSTPVTNEAWSFSFRYPSGEDGFALIEPPISSSTNSVIKDSYLIMDSSDYIEFQSSEEAREAPPVMTIFVAEAPEPAASSTDRITRLTNWAETYPSYTAYNLRTAEPTETEVDGATAIQFTTDGLYSQRVYVVFYSGNIYTFVGQYNDSSDAIHTAFTELIDSVLFN